MPETSPASGSSAAGSATTGSSTTDGSVTGSPTTGSSTTGSPTTGSPTTGSSAVGGSVTAADVEYAVRLAVDTLRGAEAPDWDAKAGGLEWDCWETVEHLADDLFSYAAQLGPRNPPSDTHVPFVWSRARPGGPANVVLADRAAGPAGLLQVLEACGALLAAVVRTTPPTVRSHHVFGAADPEGFAAMGVVETLVHLHDVAGGLGLAWTPDAALCDRVLARLFPDAPADTPRWPTLLWATGRTDLPDRPRPTRWRWYGAPAHERRP